MMKKRFVSLALAVAMVGSLTACGGGSSAPESAAGGENQATEAAADQETVIAAEGQTILKWSIWEALIIRRC